MFEFATSIVIILCAISGCVGLLCFGGNSNVLQPYLLPMPIIASMFVWHSLITTSPFVQLLPSVIGMLLIPGFILTVIAFPCIYRKLDIFDKLPLFFALSLAYWTLVAIFAYRFHLSTDTLIKVVIIFNLLGTLLLYLKYKRIHISKVNNTLENKYHSSKFILCCKLIYGVLGLLFASAIAFKAQYHGSIFDTYYHLAAFKKISAGSIVMGGDAFLGSNTPGVFHYASNPWHLVVGLASRMANVNVVWMYVFLSAMMTVIVFCVVYSLFKTIISDTTLAALGSVFISGTFIYTLPYEPQGFHLLPYPYLLCQLILFPILLKYILEYVRCHTNELWVITAVLAFSTMGQHALFMLWVPIYLCGIVIIPQLVIRSSFKRAKTVALISEVALLSILLLSLAISFHLSASMPSIRFHDRLADWKDVWFFNDDFFAGNPKYLLDKGWQEIIGLIVLVYFLLSRRQPPNTHLPEQSNSSRQSHSFSFIVGVIMALITPTIIIFNPIIVPVLMKIIVWPHFFHRMIGSNVILTHILIYGALVCIVFITMFRSGDSDRSGTKRWISVLIVLFMTFFPLASSNIRNGVVDSFLNIDNYPNILNSINQHPYYELARLEPGIVAVDINRAEMVAALTPHYVVTDTETRNIDWQNVESRMVDNDKIRLFEGSPDEVRHLLIKYRCNYVVVSRVAKNLYKFKENNLLFEQVADAGDEIIFRSKI